MTGSFLVTLLCPLMLLSNSLVIQQSLAADDVNHSLLKEVRAWTSAYSSLLLNTNISCDGLIYDILEDENYNCTTDMVGSGNSGLPPSPELPLIFKWPITVTKTIRCFCALSVFRLMISRDLDSDIDAFCTESSTFTCDDSDCEYYIANQTSTSNYENKCLVRANSSNRHTATQLKTANVSIVAIFNGLSCDVIRDYREDICDVVYNINTAGITESPTGTEGSTATDDGEFENLMIAVGVLALILILILAIVGISVVFCYINRKRKREIKALKGISKQSSGYSVGCVSRVDSTMDNPLYAFPVTQGLSSSALFLSDDFKSKFESKIIQREDLKIVSELGQGAFGIVYKGVTADTELAVKTLKDNSTMEEMREFLSEAVVMADFDHPNVMNLLGVCLDTEDKQPMIVLPYMVNGDLKAFLVANRKGNSVETLPEDLDLLKLKSMCLNIAVGMKYLAELKYVHRDLAARNCMVDNDLNIKVADFGFTRDIYGEDYYRLTRKTRLPVKWMSPESLLDNVYTEKTDVWSFGVTCWEVYSLGRAPYPGIDNGEIPTYISNGNKLSKPFLCPKEMYSIIKSCWNIKPEMRLTFNELVVAIGRVGRKEVESSIDEQWDHSKERNEHHYFQLDQAQLQSLQS